MSAYEVEEVREYLLGGLSPEHREALARRYFESDEFFEYVEAFEGDLIASYLRGDLNSRDRSRFEERFLDVPELRARVDEARALRQALEAVESVKSGVSDNVSVPPVRITARRRFVRPLSWGLGAAAAFCLIWFAGTWRARWQALETEVARLESELHQQQVRLESLTAAAANDRGAFPIAVATLTSRSLRSSGRGNLVTLESGTQLVRLRLVTREDPAFGAYRGSLRKVDAVSEQNRLWMQDGLEAHTEANNRIVEILLPASILSHDDYLLSLEGRTLRGFERTDTFQFRVIGQ
jgi:hypothetical protein